MNHPLSILIVDENGTAACAHQAAWERQGHRIRIAHDGLGALDEAAVHSFDAAVIDMALPGFVGHTIAKLLRSDPAQCNLSLVALSHRAQPADVQASRQMGFDAVVVKPVTSSYLLDVIAGTVSAREERRRAAGSASLAPSSSDAPAAIPLRRVRGYAADSATMSR